MAFTTFRTAILSIAVLSLFSCRAEKQEDNTIIPVGGVFPTLTELKASDYFTNIRFIPLQTTTESLIGKSPIWHLTDQYIVVTTGQNQCLVFDKETGSFRGNVGHVGEDPEGYSSARGKVNPVNEYILFNGWRNEVIYYSPEGDWVQRIPVPEIKGVSSLGTFFPVDEELIISYFPNLTGDEEKRLLFFNTAGEKIALLPNEQEVTPFAIEMLSVIKSVGEANLFEVLGIDAILHIGSEDKDIGNQVLSGLNPFWKYKDQIFFKEEYNDTIYRIQDTQLIPDRVFDLGKYHWPYAERYMKTRDHRIYISHVMEGENLLLFRFSTGIHGTNRTDYNGIYHKTTGQVHINPLKNGIRDDITGFLDIQPVAASPDGTLLAVLTPEDIADWIDRYGKQALPPELQHLLKVREDDNPVILLLE